MTEQVKPLINSCAPIWEHEGSKYPDLIKVPMENGVVVTYHLDVRQPIPQITDVLVRMMEKNSYGGKKPNIKGGKNHE